MMVFNSALGGVSVCVCVCEGSLDGFSDKKSKMMEALHKHMLKYSTQSGVRAMNVYVCERLPFSGLQCEGAPAFVLCFLFVCVCGMKDRAFLSRANTFSRLH